MQVGTKHFLVLFIPCNCIFFLGTAPVVPFMSTYAKDLGFSSLVVGIIYTVLPVAGMLAKPTMGALADRFQAQKVIFLIAGLVAACAMIGLNFMPTVQQERKIHFSCDNLEAVMDTCVGGKEASFNHDQECGLKQLTDNIGNTPVVCDVSVYFLFFIMI